MIIGAVLLSSCYSRYLVYDIEMIHPVKSKSLEYENDTFSIAYQVDYQKIHFTILNKIQDGIKINWDEVSFSINGQAMRAVHKATGVYKINDVQPPTTIPPKSTLTDYVLPSSHIQYINVSTRTYTIARNIIPVEARNKKSVALAINKYKGTKITVFLPVYIAGKYQSYYYDLLITDVRPSKKGSNVDKKNN